MGVKEKCVGEGKKEDAGTIALKYIFTFLEENLTFFSSVCHDCIKGCSPRVCNLFYLVLNYLFFLGVAKNVLIITQ